MRVESKCFHYTRDWFSTHDQIQNRWVSFHLFCLKPWSIYSLTLHFFQSLMQELSRIDFSTSYVFVLLSLSESDFLLLHSTKTPLGKTTNLLNIKASSFSHGLHLKVAPDIFFHVLLCHLALKMWLYHFCCWRALLCSLLKCDISLSYWILGLKGKFFLVCNE